ncbi:MAG: rRNA maturation RNase YbeY [Clostridia bacterium]|nr:rRNA maturation RNase YbeY [Clostridia bacterium]
MLNVYTEDTGFGLEKAARAIYDKLLQRDDLAVEITFVSSEEIKKLNAEYRDKDAVTDVLSFPYLDGIKGKVLDKKDYPDDVDEEGNLLIGSVCICLERAREQAETFGHSLEREVVYLAVHGVLHCFGYDHVLPEDESEMTSLAEEIMTSIGIGREDI